MKLPTEKECFMYFDKYHTPDIVKKHSINVMKISVFLAQRLNQKGMNINVELVKSASLIHDLFKFVEFSEIKNKNNKLPDDTINFWKKFIKTQGKSDHFQTGYGFFKDKYPELALIILKHGFNGIIRYKPFTWEEKIVSYADKRVMHDQIVSLTKRFKDGKERYGVVETPKSKLIEKEFQNVEKIIFSKIGLKPDDIGDYLEGYNNEL